MISDVEHLVRTCSVAHTGCIGCGPDGQQLVKFRGQNSWPRITPSPPAQRPFGATDDPTPSRFPVSTNAAPACTLTVIAWRLGALAVPDLWWRYTELGGNRPRAAIVEYLTGTVAWSAAEHNVLVQALNECLWELGHPSLAPYRQLPDDRRSAAAEIEGPGDLA